MRRTNTFNGFWNELSSMGKASMKKTSFFHQFFLNRSPSHWRLRPASAAFWSTLSSNVKDKSAFPRPPSPSAALPARSLVVRLSAKTSASPAFLKAALPISTCRRPTPARRCPSWGPCLFPSRARLSSPASVPLPLRRPTTTIFKMFSS